LMRCVFKTQFLTEASGVFETDRSVGSN